MARGSIVLKRYTMWLEVESFLLTIFFLYIKMLYIMFLCVEFFLKKILYLDIHVIYKVLGK